MISQETRAILAAIADGVASRAETLRAQHAAVEPRLSPWQHGRNEGELLAMKDLETMLRNVPAQRSLETDNV